MDEIDKKIKSIWNKVRQKGSGIKSDRCPEDTILSRYIDGVLVSAEKEDIEHHLAECNSCLDIVLLHKKMREEEILEKATDVPEVVLKKAMSLVTDKEQDAIAGIFDIVLKFAKETIEIIKNPGNLSISYGVMPVPVRGETQSMHTNLVTLHKTFPDIVAEIEVEKVGEGNVNINIMTKRVKSGKPPEKLRINLFNPHREIASYFAENGEAHFEGLRFGEYLIKINRKGKKIGQIGLVVS